MPFTPAYLRTQLCVQGFHRPAVRPASPRCATQPSTTLMAAPHHHERGMQSRHEIALRLGSLVVSLSSVGLLSPPRATVAATVSHATESEIGFSLQDSCTTRMQGVNRLPRQSLGSSHRFPLPLAFDVPRGLYLVVRSSEANPAPPLSAPWTALDLALRVGIQESTCCCPYYSTREGSLH